MLQMWLQVEPTLSSTSQVPRVTMDALRAFLYVRVATQVRQMTSEIPLILLLLKLPKTPQKLTEPDGVSDREKRWPLGQRIQGVCPNSSILVARCMNYPVGGGNLACVSSVARTATPDALHLVLENEKTVPCCT